MQRPPATRLQVVRSLRVGCILAGLSLAFAGVPLYGWHAGMPVGRVAVVAVLWCITTAWLVHYYVRKMPQGCLRWDGESWHWSGAAEPLKAVAIQYDFQTALWLVIVPARGPQVGVWVEADPAHMPQWRAMRRALVGCSAAGLGSDASFAAAKHASQ